MGGIKTRGIGLVEHGADFYEIRADEAMAKLGRLNKAFKLTLQDLIGYVAGPARPGCDGQQPELHVGRGKGAPIRNLTGDPVELMFRKKQIDARQYAAAGRYRNNWLLAQLNQGCRGGMTRLAATLTHEPVQFVMVRASFVDGKGKERDQVEKRPVTFPPRRCKTPKGVQFDVPGHLLDAVDHLGKAGRALPLRSYQLLEKIAGEGYAVHEVAALGTHGARKAVGKKFRHALDLLADHYNMPELSRGGRISSAHVDGYRPGVG